MSLNQFYFIDKYRGYPKRTTSIQGVGVQGLCWKICFIMLRVRVKIASKKCEGTVSCRSNLMMCLFHVKSLLMQTPRNE